jgi:hypothetical protein
MVGIFDKFVITVFDKVVEFSCNAPPKGFAGNACVCLYKNYVGFPRKYAFCGRFTNNYVADKFIQANIEGFNITIHKPFTMVNKRFIEKQFISGEKFCECFICGCEVDIKKLQVSYECVANASYNAPKYICPECGKYDFYENVRIGVRSN